MRASKVRDYFSVSLSIAARHHRGLLRTFHEDVLQELQLLAWKAKSSSVIVVRNGQKRKRFGNGKGMSLRTFTRAVNAQLYVFRKAYNGHY